jgi:hypothetical protein
MKSAGLQKGVELWGSHSILGMRQEKLNIISPGALLNYSYATVLFPHPSALYQLRVIARSTERDVVERQPAHTLALE